MLQKLFNFEWQITSKSFLLSSFLIGFSFSPTAEISRLELEFEESLPQKTGVKWSSQSRKTNFLTLPDLAFGFVHKRSGNEINHLLMGEIHLALGKSCVSADAKSGTFVPRDMNVGCLQKMTLFFSSPFSKKRNWEENVSCQVAGSS